MAFSEPPQVLYEKPSSEGLAMPMAAPQNG